MESLKILTLSGWTQPADALDVLAPHAQTFDYIDHSPESILTHKGEYDLIIGWSLGGVIARRLLARGAVQAGALISIAAPYQFVRGGEVHHAMPQDTFEQFYANFRDDTPRTSSRFHGLLLKGDSRAREIRDQLSHHPRLHETPLWLRWMDFLREYSAHEADYSSLPKTLIIHGEQDAIIPVEQGRMLADKLGAKLHLLPGAAHAPHLHDPAGVRRAIEEFIV